MNTNKFVAVYSDFENIHASIFECIHGAGTYKNRFCTQDAIVDINALMHTANKYGSISINRAYANFQWLARYRDSFLSNCVDLIQLFPIGGAKNGADIRLCLDAQEDIIRHPHISTVVIITGDSDFMPLAQKLKAAGKYVVGIGCESSTSKYLAQCCNEFLFYNDIASHSSIFLPSIDSSSTNELTNNTFVEEYQPSALPKAELLLLKAVRLLTTNNECLWVNKASIRPMMIKLDPEFHPKYYGFTSFADFMIKHATNALEMRLGVHDQEYRLKNNSDQYVNAPSF